MSTNPPEVTHGLFANIVSHIGQPGWIAPQAVVQVLKYKADVKTNIRFLVHDGKNTIPCLAHEAPEGMNLSDPNAVSGSMLKIVHYSIKTLRNKYYLLLRYSQFLGLGEYPKDIPVSLPAPGVSDVEIFSFTDSKASDNADTANSSTNGGNSSTNTAHPGPASVPRKDTSHFTEINALTPFTTKWTICARVETRSAVRTFKSKAGNDGKLFNVTLVDKSGEIRGTGFTEFTEQYYDKMEPGSVFIISGARVNAANKKFSTLKHDYEIMFDRGTKIERADSYAESVPKMVADFTPIEKLPETAVDSVINVIGVVHEVFDAGTLTSKAGREFTKRDISLVDKALYTVRLTLWGETATSFDESKKGHVIAVKGAKVSEFSGRSLSVLSSGVVTSDPDIEEAYNLQGWYQNGGQDSTFKWISTVAGANTIDKEHTYMTLRDARDNCLGMSEKPDYFSTIAVVTSMGSHTPYYPACTQSGCSKKVFEQTNGMWRCEKCDVEIERPNYRYILGIPVNDYTDQIWISLFDEAAQSLLGVSANELYDYQQESEMYQHVLNEFNHNEYVFRIRAKNEVYNNTSRVKYQVLTATPADFKNESNKLIEFINQY